jgi:hypothetical protein
LAEIACMTMLVVLHAAKGCKLALCRLHAAQVLLQQHATLRGVYSTE